HTAAETAKTVSRKASSSEVVTASSRRRAGQDQRRQHAAAVPTAEHELAARAIGDATNDAQPEPEMSVARRRRFWKTRAVVTHLDVQAVTLQEGRDRDRRRARFDR